MALESAKKLKSYGDPPFFETDEERISYYKKQKLANIVRYVALNVAENSYLLKLDAECFEKLRLLIIKLKQGKRKQNKNRKRKK
jgi:hypothetical protein